MAARDDKFPRRTPTSGPDASVLRTLSAAIPQGAGSIVLHQFTFKHSSRNRPSKWARSPALRPSGGSRFVVNCSCPVGPVGRIGVFATMRSAPTTGSRAPAIRLVGPGRRGAIEAPAPGPQCARDVRALEVLVSAPTEQR